LPCNTVTLAGTVAAALLLDRVTSAPPAGAALERVTVPVDCVPPVTLVGLTDTDVMLAAWFCCAPTDVPGSLDGSLRTSTLLKFAVVPASAYKAMAPAAKAASLVCN